MPRGSGKMVILVIFEQSYNRDMSQKNLSIYLSIDALFVRMHLLDEQQQLEK